MSKLFIPFSSLNADGPSYSHPGKWNDVNVLENYDDVIPGPQGAALPRRTLSALTTPALTGKCLGCASFRNQAGEDMVFAGDSTKLYRAFSTITGTFTFSSIGGAAYNTASGELWEFAEFTRPSGTLQQRIIATNFSDHVQCLAIRGSTTMTFSDLISAGTKPKARHVAVIGQFAVLGNIDTATSSTADYAPSRVHWSAFGDPHTFTPSAATQCDFEDLQSGGAVQKLIGGNEYGLIFQETQVQVMRYVGGTTIFDFAPVAYAPGTPIPSSVIYYGGSVYYISAAGFEELRGLEIKHIGSNFVDWFLWRNLERTRIQDITVAVDSVNKLIVWAVPTNTSGFAVRAFVYKFDDGRWTTWTSVNIEALALIRQGRNQELFVGFDTSHKLGTFTGAVQNAFFETKALQPVPGKRWQCNGIRVLMDNSNVGITPTGTATVRVFDTPMPATTPSSTSSTSLNPDNYIGIRTAGRYQKFALTLNCGSSGALTTRYTGMELDYEVLGDR